MTLTAAERTINERSTFVYRAFVADGDGAAVPLAGITSLKLSLYDRLSFPNGPASSSDVLNSRYEQNVLNLNNVTYASSSAAISAASNTSPIVVTSVGHGLVTGDVINIIGVIGNDGANNSLTRNPVWTIDKLSSDTFSLDGSSGTGAYVSGGTWSKSLLTWTMQPLDNQIVSASLVYDELEEHVACFEFIWTTGQKYHTWSPLVRCLGIGVPF